MSTPSYDRSFWEALWVKTLREHGEHLAGRAPHAGLVSEASRLTPGRALDAGCGHGAESLWLAGHGWQVTGVDFSAAALEHARATARTVGLAERVHFVEGDLSTWSPPRDAFDLVTSLYVHVAGSLEAFVQRLAGGVAPGGTLYLVGHQPIDPATGLPTRAAGQTQVSLAAARAALSLEDWSVLAEERARQSGGGVDAVILAQRQR